MRLALKGVEKVWGQAERYGFLGSISTGVTGDFIVNAIRGTGENVKYLEREEKFGMLGATNDINWDMFCLRKR